MQKDVRHRQPTPRQVGAHRGSGPTGSHGGESLVVRAMRQEDKTASGRLAHEAFGLTLAPEVSAPGGPTWAELGVHPVGMYDGDLLVGRVHGREFAAYFGGRVVPLWGIGGVTIQAEYRGRGGLAPLFAQTFADARDHGAAVSSLATAAAGAYRRFGYEVVNGAATVTVHPRDLVAVRPPTGITLERAGHGDHETLRAVYTRWAIEQNGTFTRTGPPFADYPQSLLDDATGVTLAVDDHGAAVGYAAWTRGQGDHRGTLQVSELISVSGDASRALLRFLGSFGTNVHEIAITTSGFDPVALALPSGAWQLRSQGHYMFRVLDPIAAIEARGYSPLLNGAVEFLLEGDSISDNDGGYRIEVADGRAHCATVSASSVDGPILTPAGLALIYAGTQSVANVRLAGLASADATEQDSRIDALFGGRQFHIRNRF